MEESLGEFFFVEYEFPSLLVSILSRLKMDDPELEEGDSEEGDKESNVDKSD